MLTEIPAPADSPPGRRWFRGDALELVVWSDADGIRQYQLRYRRPGADGVYEWRRAGHLYHYALDDGEGRAARVDATPVLTADAPGHDSGHDPADLAWVRDRFAEESEGLEAGVRTFVEQTLAETGR